jgi:hypothetical protein
VDLTPDLAADLAAAFLDRRAYHHELCGSPCSCGFPALIADLVDALLPGFADAVARLGLEGKPFWPEDHPGLLPTRVAAHA